MAVPYYNVGTATLTAGSAAMVGQGTLWAGNVRPGDTVVSYSGQTAIVDTVNSNTSITLSRAFRGTSQTAAAYEIIFSPADATVAQDVSTVLNAIRSSALVGLGNLTPAARKLPFFGPSGAAALTDLSDFSRTLLDDANAAAWLATLGAQSQFSGLTIPGGDYNNAAADGIYNGLGNGGANGPPTPSGYGPLWVGSRSGSNGQIFQISGYASATDISLYCRGKDGANPWCNWLQLTGSVAVLSNGTVMRLPNGLQICTVSGLTASYNDAATLAASWTFPAAFSTAIGLVCTWSTPSLPANGKREMTQRVVSKSTAGVQLQALNNSAWASGDTISIDATATGRWF
ncbi:MAG: hypothetical protein WBA42_01365 [Mesorhizobium sp.]